MLRIAVVDDEAEQRELIESFLARFACEQRREIIVDTYCNGFDFLSVHEAHDRRGMAAKEAPIVVELVLEIRQ